MNIRSYVLVLLTLAVSHGATSDEQRSRGHTNVFSMVFEDAELSHSEKWRVAKDAKSLSLSEREYLRSRLADTSQGDSWYYALTALAAAGDQESAPFIGEELLRNDNRYFALALGMLGNSDGVPYLQEALNNTQRPHVSRACRVALRMLNARSNDVPPPPSRDDAFQIQLLSSSVDVALGEPFEIRAVIQNNTTVMMHVAWADAFFENYIQAYSADGDYVIPVTPPILDREPSNRSFPPIAPNDQLGLSNTCIIDKSSPVSNDWPEVLPSRSSFVLRAVDNSWAVDVAPYSEGRSLVIDAVIVYDPVSISDSLASRLGISPYDICTNRIISSVLRLNLISE
ncbi:MAG: hypothetical protein M9935_10145 [Kiritimatiellae bacterium]|nr:hypothetical protein [Kiritimatiellia bacterium]